MKTQQLLSLYQQMVRLRQFEEKLLELFSTRIMPGTMHQYNGQEAVAVGICENLRKDDYVTSTHRGHGHCIAKGANINAVMAEMFAKRTGCCKGMGGSMHIADFSVGMLGANGIVGGGIPIAVGAGLMCKYKKLDRVSVSFFGDGATNEGSFHEAVNLASTWQLPVVFVIENNLYGFSTHYKKTMLLDNIADRAEAYGIPGVVVDGMNVQDVYNKSSELIEKARLGKGPSIIEAKTYRYRGHSRFEDPSYRTKEELNKWRKKDPIDNFKRFLKGEYGFTDDEFKSIDNEVKTEIEAAVEFAEKSQDAQPGDYKQYIFA